MRAAQVHRYNDEKPIASSAFTSNEFSLRAFIIRFDVKKKNKINMRVPAQSKNVLPSRRHVLVAKITTLFVFGESRPLYLFLRTKVFSLTDNARMFQSTL